MQQNSRARYSSTVKFDSIAADLRSWLQESVERGCARDAMEQSLRAAGYQPKFSSEAVHSAFAKFAPEPSGDVAVAVQSGVDMAAQARTEATVEAGVEIPTSSSEILASSPNAIETSDRKVEMLFALNAPRIVLFGSLLSHEECDQMIALARPKLQRSTVVNAATGSYDVHTARTSSGTHFERGETDLVRKVETRIAELLSIPLENGEPIQILHYMPGAEYKPHFDFFDPALSGNEKVLSMGGQRTATLIMYLNDVEAGGSTIFPEVGLDVLPRKGNAIFFAYSSEKGELDRRTLHGGSPVAEGEKWIATKWLRLNEYKNR